VKIQCYIQLLIGGDISAAANTHTMCDNAAADMHMFDITVPDLIPYAAETLGSMGLPIASCAYEESDGESAYGDSEYDESAYDESAASWSSTSAAPYDFCGGEAFHPDRMTEFHVTCNDPGLLAMMDAECDNTCMEWYQGECCGELQ